MIDGTPSQPKELKYEHQQGSEAKNTGTVQRETHHDQQAFDDLRRDAIHIKQYYAPTRK